MASQVLPGLHSGVMSTLTAGDTMSRSMGQYGKNHTFTPATPQGPQAAMTADTAGLPNSSDAVGTGKAGMVPVRGGAGGIKRNPKLGGMGPGPDDSYGTSSRDYGKSGDNS